MQELELYLNFPEHTQTQPPVLWLAEESVINGTLLQSMDGTGDGSASSESQPWPIPSPLRSIFGSSQVLIKATCQGYRAEERLFLKNLSIRITWSCM